MNMKDIIALTDIIEPKCKEIGVKPMFKILGSEVLEFSITFKDIK
jgi:hypothetical protein